MILCYHFHHNVYIGLLTISIISVQYTSMRSRQNTTWLSQVCPLPSSIPLFDIFIFKLKLNAKEWRKKNSSV